MPVYYDSKKIIPAPLVEINRQLQKAGDGSDLNPIYTLQVQGELIAWKGSPSSSGTFWTGSDYPPDEVIPDISRLKAILLKQEALKDLFCAEGKWFEIQPYDGSAPLKCKPRNISIQFPAGIWHSRCPYTITLETDEMYINGVPSCDSLYSIKISAANETWAIEFNEQSESPELIHTFRLTHSLTATGKRFFDDTGNLIKPAWQQARDWVLPRLGIDGGRITASGVLNLPSYYQGFNHARSENVDANGGNYSVTESWILASGNALEDFTVESNNSIQDGLVRVSLNGAVNGLETRNLNFQITEAKYTNAINKYDVIKNQLLSRAQSYSGVTLNPQSTALRVGRNITAGIITYSVEYDNRPTNYIANALTEQITIIDNNPNDVFASIAILGILAGPILQPINTVTAKQRQLNVSAIMPVSGISSDLATAFNQKPNIDNIILAATGTLTFTQIFKDQDTESFEPKTGSFSHNLSWTFS